jgi:hypothetical protein
MALTREVERSSQAAAKAKMPRIKGTHPGFSHLKSQLGVYRCKLWPSVHKAKPEHADYSGILQLTGSRAQIYLWVHEDGSLGLRLEKIIEERKSPNE